MTRRASWIMAAFVALAALAAPGIASAIATLPGTAVTPSPMAVPELNAASVDTTRAVYSITVGVAETINLSLTTDAAAIAAGLDLDVYLYGPGTTTLNQAAAIREATGPATAYPETISYQVPAAGTYYIEVFAFQGTGISTLSWSVAPEPLLPVFRFYNVRTGTHFYTASETERNTVIAKWPNVFGYEGVAYTRKATRNPDPLHRFYNVRNGSHFYTASAAEKDRVLATWPSVFQYEGAAYGVSLLPEAGKAPIYRFYNVRNGSHFYTASLDEAATVRQKWPTVYADEGIAFYVGQ